MKAGRCPCDELLPPRVSRTLVVKRPGPSSGGGDRGQPTLTPREFAQKWGDNETKEKAASQEHFIDLCRMLGEPTPNDQRL